MANILHHPKEIEVEYGHDRKPRPSHKMKFLRLLTVVPGGIGLLDSRADVLRDCPEEIRDRYVRPVVGSR